MPSVTIRLSIPKRTMSPPLIRPISNAADNAARIARDNGQSRFTLRWATITAPRPATEATDRSKSPVVSGMIKASVITTRMALDDRMEETFDHWAKVSGLTKLKMMMMTSHASGSAYASSAPAKRRWDPGAFTGLSFAFSPDVSDGLPGVEAVVI